MRRGTVGIDVINVGREDPCLSHGDLHRHTGSTAIWGWGSYVICIVSYTIAHDLGKDIRIPFYGMRIFFKNKNSGSFT